MNADEAEMNAARIKYKLMGLSYGVDRLFDDPSVRGWHPMPLGFRLLECDVNQLGHICKAKRIHFIRRRKPGHMPKSADKWNTPYNPDDYIGIIVALPDYLLLKEKLSVAGDKHQMPLFGDPDELKQSEVDRLSDYIHGT